MQVAWDIRQSPHKTLVVSTNGLVEATAEISIPWVLKPLFVRQISPYLITFTTRTQEVGFDGRATLLPSHEVVHRQRNTADAAIAAGITVPLENDPRDSGVDLPLALAKDDLREGAIRRLGEDFGLQEICLPNHGVPILQAQLQDLLGMAVLVLREKAKKSAPFALENRTRELDRVAKR